LSFGRPHKEFRVADVEVNVATPKGWKGTVRVGRHNTLGEGRIASSIRPVRGLSNQTKSDRNNDAGGGITRTATKIRVETATAEAKGGERKVQMREPEEGRLWLECGATKSVSRVLVLVVDAEENSALPLGEPRNDQ
jgi:hypothetical protein